MRYFSSFSRTKASARSSGRASGALYLALALLLPAAAAAAPPVTLAWEIPGSRAPHCLVASVPALTARDTSLPPAIESCYRRGRRVVFETLARARLDEIGYVQLLGNLAGHATAGDLEASVGAPLFERLERRLIELGLDVGQFAAFRPWYAAEMLHAFVSIGTPARSDLGVERQLYRRSWKDRKQVLGLETDNEHAHRLAAIGGEAEQGKLRLVLEARGDAAAFQQRIGAWRSADLSQVEAELASIKRDYPAYYEERIRRRHQLWMPRLLELLEQGDPHVIVLDVLDLAGPDGILQLLAAAGRAPAPLAAERSRRRF